MPYVDKATRARLTYSPPGVPGELNYQVTREIIRYLNNKGLSYQTCNDIVGALENAKHEFQRRVQDPYEDSKIETNGDVGY